MGTLFVPKVIKSQLFLRNRKLVMLGVCPLYAHQVCMDLELNAAYKWSVAL